MSLFLRWGQPFLFSSPSVQSSKDNRQNKKQMIIFLILRDGCLCGDEKFGPVIQTPNNTALY